MLFNVQRDRISSPTLTGLDPNSTAYYRIGWKLDANGQIDHWSDPIAVPRIGFAKDRPGGAIAIAETRRV